MRERHKVDDPMSRLMLELIRDSVTMLKKSIRKNRNVEFSGNSIKADKFFRNEIDFIFGNTSRISFERACEYLGESVECRREEIKKSFNITQDVIDEILSKNGKDKVFNQMKKGDSQ